MEMLLRNLTITELADLFDANMSCSPAPRLIDDKTVEKARASARKNGVWDDLSKLDPDRPIPVLKRSDYRNFQRTGDRLVPQAHAAYRREELNRAALALWLRHPHADIDYLQDLLWAYADDWTWVMAAHEGRSIDLGSAVLGAKIAEILHVLGEHLEGEVKERAADAVDRHIFNRYWDCRHLDFWQTKRSNWNHVCNGELIRTALYLIDDPHVLAHMTHGMIQHMTYAIDGFSDDGGCLEGPGYWGYGFGHYLTTAHALYCKTDGEVNIMKDDTGKLARICQYPLAAHIEGPWRSTFADSVNGYIPAASAMLVNFFYDLPELYTLCDLHPDKTLKVNTMEELALYTGFKVDCEAVKQDSLLPSLGQVKLCSSDGERQMTIICLAGHNGVPHNHNDIGSFIVYRNGKLLLTDPGKPVYSRKTFGPHRYEIPFCSALGHSVPIINAVMQEAGREYYGTLEVDNLHGEGIKKAVIDMSNAYPQGTVESFIRTFALDADSHLLVLEDCFEFSDRPQSLEEGFVTLERVKVKEEGVQIGTKASGLTLKAENCQGDFSVEKILKQDGCEDDSYAFTRIRFIPEKLSSHMKLRFCIK